MRRSQIMPRVTSASATLGSGGFIGSVAARRLIGLGKPVSSSFDTVPTLPDLVSALFKEPTTNGSVERPRVARSLRYILRSTSAKAYQVSGSPVVGYALIAVCWHVPVVMHVPLNCMLA